MIYFVAVVASLSVLAIAWAVAHVSGIWETAHNPFKFVFYRCTNRVKHRAHAGASVKGHMK